MENIKELIQVAVSDIWKVAEKKLAHQFISPETGKPMEIKPYVEWESQCPVAYAIVDFAEAQIDAYNTVLTMAGMSEMKLPPAPEHILNAIHPHMREHYK